MTNQDEKLAAQKLGHALQDLLIVEQDARDFGFAWPNLGMIVKQALSECAEITEAIVEHESKERIQEEISDLLHAALSMCVFMDYDLEEVLVKINKKFSKRMATLKDIAQEHGLSDLKGQPIEAMLKLWDKAKLYD